jgi:hypothetical protein
MTSIELFRIDTLQDTQLKTVHTKQSVLTTFIDFNFLKTNILSNLTI